MSFSVVSTNSIRNKGKHSVGWRRLLRTMLAWRLYSFLHGSFKQSQLWTQLDPSFSQSSINKVITNCDSIDHLSPKHVNHTIRDYDQFLPQLRRLKQNKILYKNNLYMTCTQNWEVPVSYHSINVILTKRERTRENSISNTSWEIPLLKSFKKSTARSITKLWMQIMFV